MTAVIPLRSVNATQIAQDLRPLVDAGTILTANASSNSLLVTDVSSTIHRILSIVSQLDSHMTEASSVRVIQLDHANAADAARVINELFRERRPEISAGGTPRMGSQPVTPARTRSGGRGG